MAGQTSEPPVDTLVLGATQGVFALLGGLYFTDRRALVEHVADALLTLDDEVVKDKLSGKVVAPANVVIAGVQLGYIRRVGPGFTVDFDPTLDENQQNS